VESKLNTSVRRKNLAFHDKEGKKNAASVLITDARAGRTQVREKIKRPFNRCEGTRSGKRSWERGVYPLG